MAWLLPLAMMGLGIRAGAHGFRRPLAPSHLSLLLWFGWLFTYSVVYSFAGGFFQFYYLATMAIPS